jgi:hypothetical protein
VCRAALVALRRAAKVRSGGVTSAERLSLLPAITNRAKISVLPLRRKSSVFSLEYRPQADTGFQPPIIQQEGGSRDSIRADDALVAVYSQQPAGCALLCRRDRHDPLVTKMFSEKPLLYSARRI